MSKPKTYRPWLPEQAWLLPPSPIDWLPDVDPGNRSRVNESLHPARLGRGLHHETNQAHSGADWGCPDSVDRRQGSTGVSVRVLMDSCS